MIDHEMAAKQNQERMKQVYQQLSTYQYVKSPEAVSSSSTQWYVFTKFLSGSYWFLSKVLYFEHEFQEGLVSDLSRTHKILLIHFISFSSNDNNISNKNNQLMNNSTNQPGSSTSGTFVTSSKYTNNTNLSTHQREVETELMPAPMGPIITGQMASEFFKKFNRNSGRKCRKFCSLSLLKTFEKSTLC